MKILIQKVKNSKLFIDNKVRGEIKEGYLLFLGIENKDIGREEKIVDKLLKIKFIDKEGKFKKSISKFDNKISLMIIPNITLVAKIEKNGLEFKDCLDKKIAKNIYKNFLNLIKNRGLNFVNGIFGADMLIESQNNGPINIILDL